MEKMIGGPPVGNSAVAGRPGAGVDFDRVRWKAIYLSTLLLAFVPDDTEGETQINGLRERVQTLVGSGELSVVGDYERCLEPLAMVGLELVSPVAGHQGPIGTTFYAWIDDFPLFPLAGSVASVGDW